MSMKAPIASRSVLKKLDQIAGYKQALPAKTRPPKRKQSSILPDASDSSIHFSLSTRRYQKSLLDQRLLVEQIGEKLGISANKEDLHKWYNVNLHTFGTLGGSNLVNRSGKSLQSVLQEVYPNYPWQPWKFERVPAKHWINLANQRNFFDWVATQLNITEPQQWYQVRVLDIYRMGGSFILHKLYKDSLYQSLKTIYPEIEWLPWKFERTSQESMKDKESQKRFFEWLFKELKLVNQEDWYNVTQSDIKRYGGNVILQQYNNLLVNALKALYPEHEWLPWKFQRVQNAFWNSLANQKQYLDWLGKQVGMKELDDWYKITLYSLEPWGIRGLLGRYNNSLYLALRTVYPMHEWFPWKFTQVSKSTVWDQATINLFLKDACEKLHINTLSDWERISLAQLRSVGGLPLLRKFRTMYNLLSSLYPSYNWNRSLLSSKGKRATQRWLSVCVQTIFPNQGDPFQLFLLTQLEVYEDYRHPDLKFIGTHVLMQLDVFVPSLSVAFEYQGEHHYSQLHFFAPRERVGSRDHAKREACKLYGITLIEIPFWWNKNVESLIQIIQQVNPKLIPNQRH